MKDIYSSNEYITKNPSLHEEDSPWKVEKIIPLVDKFINTINKNEINVLDVGGGTGLILKAVSDHIEKIGKIKVNKFALDLSPGALKIQRQNNPDLIKALNESICATSLNNKKIDLTLMIDVLEHIPDDRAALEELKRVSKFVIFKVPLEDNFFNSIQSSINQKNSRDLSRRNYGHINFYTYRKLKQIIQKHLGAILTIRCVNVFSYFRKSPHYNKNMKFKNKLFCLVASWMFELLPSIVYSLIFGDFAIILVECEGH